MPQYYKPTREESVIKEKVVPKQTITAADQQCARLHYQSLDLYCISVDLYACSHIHSSLGKQVHNYFHNPAIWFSYVHCLQYYMARRDPRDEPLTNEKHFHIGLFPSSRVNRGFFTLGMQSFKYAT